MFAYECAKRRRDSSLIECDDGQNIQAMANGGDEVLERFGVMSKVFQKLRSGDGRSHSRHRNSLAGVCNGAEDARKVGNVAAPVRHGQEYNAEGRFQYPPVALCINVCIEQCLAGT